MTEDGAVSIEVNEFKGCRLSYGFVNIHKSTELCLTNSKRPNIWINLKGK